MPCPYFTPRRPAGWRAWRGRLRPPLGELYEGACAAVAPSVAAPAEALVESCNMGYASGCNRLPAHCPADAARFSIASDDGFEVVIRWSTEKDLRPLAAGRATFERAADRCSDEQLSEPLRAQVEAYARSYLRSIAVRRDV